MERPPTPKSQCSPVTTDWLQAEGDAKRRHKALEELERAHPQAKH